MKAPIYMDIMAIYFAILPILFAFSVFLAVKKKYKLHFQTQTLLLASSLIVILYFEINVRLYGGFVKYSDNSSLSFEFLLVYLIIHIIIATTSLGGWLYLYIISLKEYKNSGIKSFKSSKHKKIGKAIFYSMSLSSYMGVLLYVLIFYK
jgi:putative membrane protein